MKHVSEQDIRGSFVNCSKGEAGRLTVPRDLAERVWDELDYLGWRDPAAPDRAYLVTEHGGRLVGVALRVAQQQRGASHRSMCSLCLTTHPGTGVSLMTGRKAGAAGRQGNSVGLYLCSDLACSLYLRGRRKPETGGRVETALPVPERAARMQAKLAAFLDRLLD